MADISIVLKGVDEAKGVIDSVGGALDGLGSIAAGIATAGIAAAAAGVTALGVGLGIALNEAMDAQVVMAQTEAVIKSTGGAAGMTAEQVADLATAISTQSRYSDDAIQSAENLLLTFTNIGQDVFPDATQAMVDMAAAMGTDVKSGAIQLGKALNDPIAGISALQRVGVSFTEEQKSVIQSLVDTGDVAGAQQLILAELNKEFGGSAQAQAETFAGKLDVVKNQLLNVAEGIGTALLPVLSELFDSVITPAIPIIEEFGNALGVALEVLAEGDLGGAFDALNEFDGVRAIFQGLGIDLTEVGGNVEDFVELAKTQWSSFLTAIQPIIDAAGNLLAAFQENLPMMQQYFADMVAFVLEQVNILSPTLITNISDTLNSLATFWREHGDTVMGVVNFVFRTITVTIGGTLTILTGLISAALELINGDWTGAWQTISDTATTFMNSVLSIVGTDLETFTATWQTNWDLAVLIVTTIWQQITDAIGAKLTEITTAIQTAISGIITWFGTITQQFVDVGKGIIDSITAGVIGAAINLANAVVSAVSGALAATGLGGALGGVTNNSTTNNSTNNVTNNFYSNGTGGDNSGRTAALAGAY